MAISSAFLNFVFACALLVGWVVYKFIFLPQFNPLRKLGGPPFRGLFAPQLNLIMDPTGSPVAHELFVKRYGRNIRLRGIGPWDNRLLTLDTLSMSHILKNSAIYEKPWQSRRLITSLIGCGMLSAEGAVHKRQRRVATPAFSVQNMRALIPIVFRKGEELKDKLMSIISEKSTDEGDGGARVDIAHWLCRITFDVIGLAGFGYHFNAIHNESNELFGAYRDMFEIAISQTNAPRVLMGVHFPFLFKLFPDKVSRTLDRCREIIHRVAGQLVQERTKQVMESEKNESISSGKDLLTLLVKSNMAIDLPPEQRISDEDILHNINTFLFAGSDTTSLALAWTFLLLAQNPLIQDRLRRELLSVAPMSTKALTSEEIESFYDTLANLPYLHNVSRESLRLIPPVHSSIRVATQDDIIPTSHPVHFQDGRVLPAGTGVRMPKGSFVYIAIEGFNLDKEIWGQDAWEFNPDRWDDLPETAAAQPWFFSNMLTFSAGPRSCIGMRFSIIEMKCFLYTLLTNFVFTPTEDKIIKANVALLRPYVSGKYKEGSQLPLMIAPYVHGEDNGTH